MSNERMLELLKIERECIQRNHDNTCNRDCLNCDLVQKDEDLMEMYDKIISEYEKKVSV